MIIFGRKNSDVNILLTPENISQKMSSSEMNSRAGAPKVYDGTNYEKRPLGKIVCGLEKKDWACGIS